MTKLFRPIALVLAAAVGMSAWAQAPTTPEQKTRMVQLIDGLEKHPYADDSNGSRKEVMEWLTDAPDVSVTVCGALLGDLERLDKEGGGDLLLQLMFSEARFILENPEKAKDDQTVHVAGLEGVLRTYQQMKTEKPGLKIASIEAVARIQADGKLAAFVGKAMDKCN